MISSRPDVLRKVISYPEQLVTVNTLLANSILRVEFKRARSISWVLRILWVCNVMGSGVGVWVLRILWVCNVMGSGVGVWVLRILWVCNMMGSGVGVWVLRILWVCNVMGSRVGVWVLRILWVCNVMGFRVGCMGILRICVGIVDM